MMRNASTSCVSATERARASMHHPCYTPAPGVLVPRASRSAAEALGRVVHTTPAAVSRPQVAAVAAAKCASTPVASGGAGGVAVVWFRADLRIDDHPALTAAAEAHAAIVPLFVLERGR